METAPAQSEMKVYIIGGPGSGKTTLSRQLGDYLGVPTFDLEVIAGAGPAPEFRLCRPIAERLAEVEQIAALPGWVTEGSFLWWTEELLRAATIVIWLDVPAHVAIRRVLSRHIREYLMDVCNQPTPRQMARAMRHPHVRHLFAFLPYTWSYYRRPGHPGSVHQADLDDGWALTRADTIHILAAYRHKVLRYTRSTQNIDVLLRFLEAGRARSTEVPV